MLPSITELEFDIEELPQDLPPIGKSFLFDFEKGDFVLNSGKLIELHGVNALKMWIEKVIRTEKFRFRIYENDEYGVTIDELIGSNFPQPFIEAEIKREITTSLLLHPHIRGIDGWSFVREGTKMKIQFSVTTAEESFEMGVAV